MRKFYLFFIFSLLALVFVGCESSSSSSNTGDVNFELDKEAVPSSSISLAISTSDVSATLTDLRVSFTGPQSGTEVLPLGTAGGDYFVNRALSLVEGDYTLTAFELLDGNGDVILLSPDKYSEIAQTFSPEKRNNNMVDKDFTIVAGEIAPLTMLVVTKDSTKPISEYGYKIFDFDLAKFDFLDLSGYCIAEDSVAVVATLKAFGGDYTFEVTKNLVFYSARETGGVSTENLVMFSNDYDSLNVKLTYNSSFAEKTFTQDSIASLIYADGTKIYPTKVRIDASGNPVFDWDADNDGKDDLINHN